jgi:transcriptional regulator with XRE-family HTH domain
MNIAMKEDVFNSFSPLDDNTDIASRFKRFRENLHLSTKHFSKSLNTSPSVISGIENGKRLPSKNILYALVDVYNCDLTWLVTGKNLTKKLITKEIQQETIIEMLTKRCLAKEQEILSKDLEIIQLKEEILARDTKINELLQCSSQTSQVRKLNGK